MAQVIKLKRSAVAGKTPQTSSLELGELAVNTNDGKIYLHRSSSSDDSIQSVLTTDATITGSLKLSGSQHISGSTNVMDDLNYGGNLSASLGSTSSFDRFTSVGTSSIGFLIATGSNLLNLTEAQTGSFASGSDVQQILDESGSYLVDADTGSLGKLTLVSDITGSITSTASFGVYIGDGSQLSGVTAGVDSTSVSGSFLGLFSGSDDLTLGGGVSGSITSTASFGFYKGDGSGLSNVTTDTTAFASGSDLHQILAESSSYVVESETGSFVVNSQTSSFASGSDLQIIQAESASYVVSTNTGSFLQNSDTASFATLVVQGDITTSGSVVAQQFRTEFVSESIIFASGSTKFGDDTTDKHRFSGSIEITGNVSGSITSTSSFGRIDAVGDINLPDNTKLNLGSDDDGNIKHTGVNLQIQETTGNIQIINYANDRDIALSTDDGSGGTTAYITLDGSTTKVEVAKDTNFAGNVSGSLTTTASFGTLELADVTGLPFATGSDLHQILTESSSYVVESETGSFASGSDVQGILDDYAKGTEISGSYLGLLSGSDDLTLGGGVSGSITSTASFGLFVGDGAGLTNVSTDTTAFASGSDLHQILAESSSYVVESETGSFLQNADSASFSSLDVVGNISSSLTSTGSFGSLVSPGLSTLGIVSATSLDADGGVTIDNITIDGTEIDLSSGDLTLDVEGNIILDANGAQIRLEDNGTEFGRFSRVSSDLVIKSISNNNDILLKGVDGSSTITALQLDMSEGGDAIFSGGVSASLGKTGSFDRLEGITFNATNTIFASGSDVISIQSKTGSYASGSDLHQFLAESASYLVDAVTSSMGATTINSTLFVQGDIATSGSITADEYIVNSSVTNVTQSFSSGSTIFGDSLDDTHKFTGSLGVTGSIAVGKPDASYNLDVNRSTAGVIAQFQFGDDTDGRIQIYADANAGSVGNDTGLSGETIYFQDDLGLRFITNSSEKMRLTTGGVLSIGATSFGTADNLKLLVAGDTGITGSLNVSGSITANHQPNVHSLSGSLHVSGGIGGVLHLSSSTNTPMIQFHQSASTAAVLLQTDEYGADLLRVVEYNNYNHQGLLIGQTFNTATGDTIRVRAGGNGDNIVEHHLAESSFMVTDTADVTTAHAKIDSSGIHTSHSIDVEKTGSFGRIDASGNVKLQDNGNVLFGASNDMNIVHDGTDTFIDNYTGDLKIRQNADDKDIIFLSDNGSGGTTTYFSLDGSSTKTVFAQSVRVADSQKIGFGNNDDLEIYHDGSNTYIENEVGNLQIFNKADDKDVILSTDDGSGGTTAYITLDGSTNKVEIAKDTNFAGNVSGSITSTGSFGDIRLGNPTGHSKILSDDSLVLGAKSVVSVNIDYDANQSDRAFVVRKDSDLANGGTELFRVNEAGNVGVGTDSPGVKLEVIGSVSGSITSTGSFGALIGDGSQLTNITSTPNSAMISGSFQGGGSTNISGSILSTGSFGRIEVVGATSEFDGNIIVGNQVAFGGNTNNVINSPAGYLNIQTYAGEEIVIKAAGNGLSISSSIDVSGSILPNADNHASFDLGSSSKRWNDVFAVQTTVGAVFETGLRSKGIGKEETGTIVVWRNGELVPCDKSEDTMVMGVVKQGKDEPIVMGAEPVLVTGDVKEGDFITTSTKLGHGKKLENGYLLKKEMFGKVIAQALENASGNSSLIKCMIRKM